MDHRLIFIEGLPGSGKSSIASELHSRIVLRDIDCSWYLEETKEHPVTPSVLRATASQANFHNRCLQSWAEFVQSGIMSNTVHILEGCAFQSTIRFMLEYGADRNQILKYVMEFEQKVYPLLPAMIYLYQENPRSFLEDIVFPKRGVAWVNKVSSYLASTPCCRERGWTDQNGMTNFWILYRNLCDEVLHLMKMPILRVEITNQNWVFILERILKWISSVPG